MKCEKMFSILVIDTEQVWRGGQHQLLALLKGLRQRGHEVHLICQPRSLLGERAGQNGITIHSLKVMSEVGPISLLRLISIFRKVRPDIVAYNTPKPIFIGTLASQFAPVSAKIIFRRVNFPLRKNPFSRLKSTWDIDSIIAISESIKLQLQMCGIPASRIKTIYEGMDFSLYTRPDQPKHRAANDPVVIGTVAHLSPEKGLHYLIEAASLIPEVRTRMRFVIVGDGKCLQELRELSKNKGLDNVFDFAGFHPSILQFMKSFDIFALPSLSEGLSSAILEAMAASLPIVATKVGGIPELVSDGENGLLVDPANPAALAQAIQHLADNPQEAALMGVRGRERMEKQFTLERKILETEQLCCALLQKSSHAPRSAYA
jgi:glycosyltransferase involved in cell wall biosynthesis